MKLILMLALILTPFLSSEAQVTPPAKLLQLETIPQPNITGNATWTPVLGSTTLYVSGLDSARVYFGTSGTDRVILGKVAGTSYVKASVFGWFQVNAVTLAEYNSIQDAVPTDWNYINFHPFDLAFTVAATKEGPGVLPEGAVLPRGLREAEE